MKVPEYRCFRGEAIKLLIKSGTYATEFITGTD